MRLAGSLIFAAFLVALFATFALLFIAFSLLFIVLRQVVLGVPLMVVQPVDQIVQPFVAANIGTVDHATPMNRIQVTRVRT